MFSRFHIPNIDYSNGSTKLIVLILIIIILSFVINYLLSQSILGFSYRIFVAPGIIVHELSHATLCLLTGAKMTKMSFFDKNGGVVEHHPSKIPILGGILISVAPFVFGAALIYILSRKIGVSGVNLTSIEFTRQGLFHYFKSSFSGLEYHNPMTLILLYLILSIAVTMTPSAQDLRNIFFSILFLAVVAIIIYRFTTIRLGLVTIPYGIFTLFSTVVFLLIFSLVLSIVVYGISKIIKPV